MNRKIKFIIFFLLTILAFACQENDIQPDFKDPEYLKNDSIKNNVCLIDNLNSNLISSEEMLAEGIYKYEYTSEPENFKKDDIIVGQTGLGYLRKVINSEFIGNTVILQTEQATLEDIFVHNSLDVNISNDINMDSDNRMKSGDIQTISENQLYVAKGIRLTEGDGLNFTINDLNLKSGNVEVKINSASFHILPNLKYDHEISWGSLKKLEFTANNASLNYEYNFSVSGKFEESEKIEADLIHVRQILPPLGIITLAIEHKVKFVYEPALNLDINYNYHSKSDYNFDIGCLYHDDNFDPYFRKTGESTSVLNNSINIAGGGTMRFALVYEPVLLIYAIEGPYLENSMYADFNAFISPSLDWDVNMGLGLDSKLGINVSIYGKELIDMSHNFELKTPDFYVAPDYLELASGNNQIGKPLEQLTEPVKVRVLDNDEKGVSHVKVYFVPESGSGSVSNDNILTDEEGYAQTYWTLGEGNVEEQKLNVLVKKGDGSYIEGAPLTFTASFVKSEESFIESITGYYYFQVGETKLMITAPEINFETEITKNDIVARYLGNNKLFISEFGMNQEVTISWLDEHNFIFSKQAFREIEDPVSGCLRRYFASGNGYFVENTLVIDNLVMEIELENCESDGYEYTYAKYEYERIDLIKSSY